MLKSYKTWAATKYAEKSARSDDMYDADQLAKLVRAGGYMSILSYAVGAWVVASLIVPAVTNYTAADFGKEGWFTLIPLIAMGLAIAFYIKVERNPAMFRLHPGRGNICKLDEWERDVKRRVAEAAIQKVSFWGAVMLGIAAIITITSVEGATPSIPVFSLFIAGLGAVNGIIAAICKAIGTLAAPSA